MPVRNAEATVGKALESVLSQEYEGMVDVIVADGSDTPATGEIIREKYPTVKLIPNPAKELVPGILECLRVSTADVIARCDGHTTLPPRYLTRAVKLLQSTGAANVGGRQQPVATTFFTRALTIAMTTPLGAGDARHRLGGSAGPVDTVYLGVAWRKVIEAVGGYNSSLIGNEDYEINYRLRERGETVWFDPSLVVGYQPRTTLRTLAKQYFRYGRMKARVARMHPSSLRWRHFAAPLLVLCLVASGILALTGAVGVLALAVPLAYFVALLIGSLVIGLRRRSFATLLLPMVLPTMHLAWGLGFFFPYRLANWNR